MVKSGTIGMLYIYIFLDRTIIMIHMQLTNTEKRCQL